MNDRNHLFCRANRPDRATLATWMRTALVACVIAWPASAREARAGNATVQRAGGGRPFARAATAGRRWLARARKPGARRQPRGPITRAIARGHLDPASVSRAERRRLVAHRANAFALDRATYFVGIPALALSHLVRGNLAGLRMRDRLQFNAGFALGLVYGGDALVGLAHEMFDEQGREPADSDTGAARATRDAISRSFQGHHLDPRAASEIPPIETLLVDAVRAAAPLLAAAHAIKNPTRRAFVVGSTLGLVIGPLFHQYAHRPASRRPRWFRLAQKARLALSSRTHISEHHAKETGGFGLVNSKADPLIDRVAPLMNQLVFALSGRMANSWVTQPGTMPDRALREVAQDGELEAVFREVDSPGYQAEFDRLLDDARDRLAAAAEAEAE